MMRANHIAVIIITTIIFLALTGCSSPGHANGPTPGNDAPGESAAAGGMTLDEALSLRRSVRQFSNKPLSPEQLLALAWAGQGITEPNRGFRTAPSAGAKFPIELYLATHDAVYHYDPQGNKLDKYIEGDKRPALSDAAVKQKPVAAAGVDIIIAGIVERTSVKYGDRAERYVLIEVGHVGQNILLEAVALGLCGVPIGAFYDDKVAEVLELPEGHHPYYILSIGNPEQETLTSASGARSRPQPRFEERKEERERMVDTQMSGFGRPAVDDKRVLDAMRNVPRHLFVPDYVSLIAYSDGPLPIGQGQTISQPYIVAFMTQLLEVDPDDRVLEIGTGSGYQAALLSELTPYVYSIEIIRDLAERAGETLTVLGYNTIKVRAADGYHGWEEYAPFDGIIVTCASGHIPPPLLDQLKPGGRMVIPVGGQFETQRLIVVRKNADGGISTSDKLPVRFVPMTGRAEENE